MAGNWDVDAARKIFDEAAKTINAIKNQDLDSDELQAGYLGAIAACLYGFGYMMVSSEVDERNRRDPVFVTKYFVDAGDREFEAESEDGAWDLANRLIDEGHYKSPDCLVIKCRQIALYSPEVTATSAQWRDSSEEAGDLKTDPEIR